MGGSAAGIALCDDLRGELSSNSGSAIPTRRMPAAAARAWRSCRRGRAN